MSDPTTETLRRTMKAVTEIAPNAPSMESIARGSSPMPQMPVRQLHGWRGPVIAVITAVAVIIVIGVVALGAAWRGPVATDTAAGAASEGWVVSAVLMDDDEAYPEGLIELLESQPGAVSVRYVTKDEALAEAIELFADDDYILETLREHPEAIPPTVRVLTDSHLSSQAIASTAADADGVVSTGLYFGTLSAYGRSAEDILSSYSPSDPAPGDHEAFLTESTVRGTIVVYLGHDLSTEELDAFTSIAVAGNGQGGAAGATLQNTLLSVARGRLKGDDDALALLNKHPEIVEAIFWSSTLDNSTDRQGIAVEFSRMDGVSAIHVGSGLFPVEEPDLPADAVKLRSWWRAQIQREIGLECCSTKSITYPELRTFLASLEPNERDAASLEQWRVIAEDACASNESDGAPITTRLRLATCPELVPWRWHTSEPSRGTVTIGGVYTPQQSPLFSSATIRNDSDEVVDMSGWLLASGGNEDNGFEFDQGAWLVPGGSASLFQWGERPQDCPRSESTTTRIFICYDPFKAPANLVLTNWPIQLFDADGSLVAEWTGP